MQTRLDRTGVNAITYPLRPGRMLYGGYSTRVVGATASHHTETKIFTNHLHKEKSEKKRRDSGDGKSIRLTQNDPTFSPDPLTDGISVLTTPFTRCSRSSTFQQRCIRHLPSLDPLRCCDCSGKSKTPSSLPFTLWTVEHPSLFKNKSGER